MQMSFHRMPLKLLRVVNYSCNLSSGKQSKVHQSRLFSMVSGLPLDSLRDEGDSPFVYRTKSASFRYSQWLSTSGYGKTMS
jgi:hypothetical protein